MVEDGAGRSGGLVGVTRGRGMKKEDGTFLFIQFPMGGTKFKMEGVRFKCLQRKF